MLINYCTNASENDEELREYSLQVPCLFIISNLSTLKCVFVCVLYCHLNHVNISLQALESFLLRCPRDISVYCDEILHLTLEYLSYDPNFTDNMEEDTDDEGLEEEEDEYVLFGSLSCSMGLMFS